MEWIPPISKEQVVVIRISDRPLVKDTASKRYLDTLSLDFYDERTFANEIDRNTPEGSCDRQVKVGHFRQLILGQKRQTKMGQFVFIH